MIFFPMYLSLFLIKKKYGFCFDLVEEMYAWSPDVKDIIIIVWGWGKGWMMGKCVILVRKTKPNRTASFYSWAWSHFVFPQRKVFSLLYQTEYATLSLFSLFLNFTCYLQLQLSCIMFYLIHYLTILARSRYQGCNC